MRSCSSCRRRGIDRKRRIWRPASTMSDGSDLLFADEPELAPDALFDRAADIGIVFEELLGVLAALTETLAGVGKPRPALFDDPLLDREIDQIAFARDALAIHHVELGFAERGRDLVLHDLHARAPADDLIAILDAGNAANIDAHRRIELQRTAAGRRFGVAEHDADLLAQLVDEDESGLRLRHDARELAQRLRHEPRLQAHLRFTHLTVDFRLRHQRRDRVDHDDVDAARANEDFGDLERLFAVIGLRDEQVFQIDP